MEKIYKAYIISYPTFFIEGISESKQMIKIIELFSNQTDAKKWIDLKKSSLKVKSSRVSQLNKHEVISSRISGSRLDIVMKIQGSIYQDFKEINDNFSVWSMEKDNSLIFAELKQDTLDFYSDRQSKYY